MIIADPLRTEPSLVLKLDSLSLTQTDRTCPHACELPPRGTDETEDAT